MIDIDLSHPEFVVLRPEGPLSEADFDALAQAIDQRINETDTIPNLVIRVDRLPHWDSVGALTRHFHFVKAHHKLLRKVAIVGDSPLLSVMRISERSLPVLSSMVRQSPAGEPASAQALAAASNAAAPNMNRTMTFNMSNLRSTLACGSLRRRPPR